MRLYPEELTKIKCQFVAVILIILLLQESTAQNPEVHQAASVTRFTGIYSFLGSYIAIREIYFLASLVCVLVAGSVFLTFFQLPSYFLPIYHNQKRSLTLVNQLDLNDIHYYITLLALILETVEVDKMVTTIYGHDVLSIPAPHADEHPGLALFTPNSIIPMLRFYSFCFRAFIFFGLTLLYFFKPLFKLIRRHGLSSPTQFQRISGISIHNMRFRSLDLDQLPPDELQTNILESIFSTSF